MADVLEAILAQGVKPEELGEFIRSLPPAERRAIQEQTTGMLGPHGRYAYDPVGFITNVLDESVWSKQEEICRSVLDNPRTAVPACFAPGKTHLAARIALWWGSVWPAETAKVVTTATTYRTVKNQLWPHIRRVHARHGLPGRTNLVEWHVGKELVSLGFSAPNTDPESLQGYHCFDDQTELLTDEGWKLFPAVTGQERVLTLKGDHASWGPITQVHQHPFDGYLNLHDGERVNFCVTDNHQFMVRDKAGRWSLREFQELPQVFKVRRTNEWGGGTNPESVALHRVGTGGSKATPYVFKFEDWCEFLGWFVSEGHVSRDGSGTATICISQKPGAKYEEIAAVLTRMGVPHGRHPHGVSFRGMGIAAWLEEHCGIGAGAKRVPAQVKESTAPMMEVFLEAFGKGDGTPHGILRGRRYYTSSKLLADDLHEMLCKLGRGRKVKVLHPEGSQGRNSLGVTFIRHAVWLVGDPGKPVDSDVLKKNVVKHRYVGTVYCVSTPTQTIMVRRRGCAMWSGNSPHLLIVVDEAGGITHAIGGALNGLMTGAHTRLLAIGNPSSDEQDTWFEKVCTSPEWNTIPIAVADTPNFTGEDAGPCMACPAGVAPHPVAQHLVDQDWLRVTLGEYGEDHPYVTAKVHARFPRIVANRTIPLDWVDEAVKLGRDPDERMLGTRVTLGVDIASDGGDELAIARWEGMHGQIIHHESGVSLANAVDVAGIILRHIQDAEELAKRLGSTERVRVKVDVIGLGWGPVSTLQRWGDEGLHGAVIVGVNVGERAKEPDKYINQRAEMWWEMRMLLQPDKDAGGKPSVTLDIDDRTKVQLSDPTHKTSTAGRRQIESKKDLRGRGRKSPDRAEALLLGKYEPPEDEERAELIV